MDKVHVRARLHVLEQLAFQVPQVVPAHVRNLAAGGGGEAAHMGVENAQTGLSGSFFAVAAKDLHAHANAQHGLPQGSDDGRKPALHEVVHRKPGVAHAGQDNLVRPADGVRIGRHAVSRPQPVQGVLQRPEIAHVIVDDGDHSIPLDEGRAPSNTLRRTAWRRALAKALKTDSARWYPLSIRNPPFLRNQ